MIPACGSMAQRSSLSNLCHDPSVVGFGYLPHVLRSLRGSLPKCLFASVCTTRRWRTRRIQNGRGYTCGMRQNVAPPLHGKSPPSCHISLVVGNCELARHSVYLWRSREPLRCLLFLGPQHTTLISRCLVLPALVNHLMASALFRPTPMPARYATPTLCCATATPCSGGFEPPLETLNLASFTPLPASYICASLTCAAASPASAFALVSLKSVSRFEV